MILISKFWVPNGYLGMTIYPFVLLKHRELKKDWRLVNHEKIHLRQQLELLILPFFIWYGIEFLLRLVQLNSFRSAYRNISFEREAYFKESDIQYLTKRKPWAFLNFL